MLAHDHVFTIDDPITKWFPEANGVWKGVTIQHLMSHTSGLADIPDEKFDMRKDYTEDELVKLMMKTPPVHSPGAEWRYNNGGYVLLGVLIHRATGKFYGDLLREKIFKPSGMTTARIISERDIVPNRASGYEFSDKGLRNQAWVSPSLNTTADGALYLSVKDFAKWDAALNNNALLPRAELEQAWTPTKLRDGSYAGGPPFHYGFGWVIPVQSGSHQLVEHGGAWQGFTTYIGRVLDRHITVVVLTNLDSDHCKPTRIGREILHVFASDVPVNDGFY
jgi:CubicO group peptidase (beta-lactamase class C family)